MKGGSFGPGKENRGSGPHIFMPPSVGAAGLPFEKEVLTAQTFGPGEKRGKGVCSPIHLTP
ncbi:MAG: hypothetical protein CM15mP130_1590 [Verrucomicrobiota bacterium]|nr:MAG: hypothetical protein CM15mP130_1590 [Verrucomicrobiota bacterium]